jgi:hypothetical protein
MNEIQIITEQWIDILILDKNKSTAKRKIVDSEYGEYYFKNDSLIIYWKNWGDELFYLINNTYVNLSSKYFKTYLESSDWNSEGIFNIENNVVECPSSDKRGTYHLKKNIISILWENNGEYEIFLLHDYGKKFISKKVNNPVKTNIRTIAIFFPQYHEVEENNKFWGNGFTEWTLLAKTEDIVKGEYIRKPHNDIGYYNLLDIEYRKYITTLCNKFNIHGLCYYHYWFKNKKVMYEGLESILKDGEPNIPFFFCWANEQWTKRWDGGNNEILLEQEYSDYEGNIDHFHYLLQFFRHYNYIKINNKPVFIFYRIEEKDVEHIKTIINLWNELAIRNGFAGIHFMRYLGPFDNRNNIDSINGYVEFEPGYCAQENYWDLCIPDDEKIFEEFNEELYLKKNIDIANAVRDGHIKSGYEHYISIDDKEMEFRTSKFYLYNGDNLYKHILNLPKKFNEQHRGITVNWNNIPRRIYSGDEYDKYPHIWKNIDTENFSNCYRKLLNKIEDTKNTGDCNENFLFITAWNEWNEQAILEPNNIDGYSYLSKINNNYLDFYNYPIKKHVLYISHRGGGTEKYTYDLEKIFPEYNFLRFHEYVENVNYKYIYQFIDIIHVNSVIYGNIFWNIHAFLNIFDFSKKIYLTIHDYQWFYPDNPNILYDDFVSSVPDSNNIDNFRKLLERCNKIIFPDPSVYINYNKHISLNKYFDKIFIVPHSDKMINYKRLYIPNISNEIHIAYIGNFVKYKGKDLFIYMSEKYTTYKNFIIKYHVFGNMEDYSDNLSTIQFHGKYSDEDIISLLHKNNIHGIVHLSQFEESYCYALTNSINSGLPILHNNLGTFRNRLEKYHPRFFILRDECDIFPYFDYIINNYGKNECDINFSCNLQPNKWYLQNY